jgi:hypothetical protein
VRHLAAPKADEYNPTADAAEAGMNRIELETYTDDQGSLHVQLPAEGSTARGPTRVHVVVEWEEAAGAPAGWPSNWFDSIDGMIDDPTFVRPPQGEAEVRDSFE